MSIEVRGIRKTFGAFTALEDIELDIPTGELVALLGPSGSGKTTLLRIIAGLEAPDAGSIRFDGEDAIERRARERGVGFVFQHYALFRHMTVFENIAFGLRVRPRDRRPSRKEIADRVRALLGLVHLDGMATRYPSQLSGGQRQRVALARALAVEPRLLLLDEPFGSLDAKVRAQLRRWLRRLHEDLKITSVFVTHDQEEAMEVADRVVVMNQGRIEQVGSPDDVYQHPATSFVYHFLGHVNLFHGRVHEGTVRIAAADESEEAQEQNTPAGEPVLVYARPHEMEVERQPNGMPSIEGVVQHIFAFGPTARLEIERADNGDLIKVEIGRERHAELGLKVGERVYVRPLSTQIFLGENI